MVMRKCNNDNINSHSKSAEVGVPALIMAHWLESIEPS